MKHLLEWRDPWGNPAAIWVLAVAAFLVPPVCYGMTFVHIENNVEHWLPDDDPLSRTFAWYRGHFPSDRKVLVSWQGARLGDPRIEKIAASLRGTVDEFGVRRGGSPYIAEVRTPEEAISAVTNHDVTRPQALRRLTGLLVGPAKNDSEKSRPAALIVTLSEAGDADEAASVAALTDAALSAGVRAEKLALGGSGVVGSELNGLLRRTAWNGEAPVWMLHRRSPMLLSLLVAVCLSFLLLHTIRMTVLVLGATLLATLTAVALVPATGGGMNMVLVLMPTLMTVLTISAAIHIVHYRDRAALAGEPDPAAAAVRTAWKPTIIAESTTAIGLISLVTSPLEPIRDFGLYSAVGCLILLPVVLWGIPAVLQLGRFPIHAEAHRDRRYWRRFGYTLVRHRRLVLASSVVLLLLGTGGMYWFKTETRAIRYLPQESDVVRDYEFLERELAGIVPVETVVAFDSAAQGRTTFSERMEMVRSVTETLRDHPDVSGALSLADFLPEAQRPPDNASFIEKAKYHRRSSLAEERVKAAGAEANEFLSICRIEPETVGADVAPSIAPGDELWRVTAHASMMTDRDLGLLLKEIDAAVASATASEKGVTHIITGAVPLFLRTQQALLDSLVVSFGTGFVMISAVIAWMLRSIRAGMLAMLPNVLPVAIVFGAVSAGGMAFDIGTMISASIAIGIAVDGTLHLCEIFRDEYARGISKRRAVANTMAACGPALTSTVLVVSGGWLMLGGAELVLVARFGWIMAVVVAAALIGDLIVMPALLAGPLGRLLVSPRSRRAAVEPVAEAPIPAPHAWTTARLAAADRHAYDGDRQGTRGAGQSPFRSSDTSAA